MVDSYVFISSCNAYASLAKDGIDEDAILNPPLEADEMTSPEEYGAAKVACEQTILSRLGADRSVIVRPGLIGGPGDPTGPTSYWPLRFARPSNVEGRVLVPNTRGVSCSVIDVRDLAEWIIRLIANATSGVFNAAGHPTGLEEYFDVARDVAGHRGPLVSRSSEWLAERGVAQWAGHRSLPLWLGEESVRGIATLSNLRAREAGLTTAPVGGNPSRHADVGGGTRDQYRQRCGAHRSRRTGTPYPVEEEF